ncbi:MAG TPA: hypothetical protein DCX14_03805 [Flavobacteriales bacterium]|nr:hypothetical protein [Flavobacteriales bacterium]
MLVWMVVVPSVISFCYYNFVVTEFYKSEARVTVVGDNSALSPVSMMMGSGFDLSSLGVDSKDLYLVESLLESYGFFVELNKRVKFMDIFSTDDLDFFHRVGVEEPIEKLHEEYLSRLEIYVDPDSSMIELAFYSQDAGWAVEVLNEIVRLGEEIVNSINNDAIKGKIKQLAQVLEDSEQSYFNSLEALNRYRRTKGIYSEADSVNSLLSSLQIIDQEITQRELSLSQHMASASKYSVERGKLESEIEALQGQREEEVQEVFKQSDGKDTLDVVAEYEKLAIFLEFSKQRYQSAVIAHEEMLSDVMNQSKYLTSILSPVAGTTVAKPMVLRSTLSIFLVSLLVFAVSKLAIATVRDHQI